MINKSAGKDPSMTINKAKPAPIRTPSTITTKGKIQPAAATAANNANKTQAPEVAQTSVQLTEAEEVVLSLKPKLEAATPQFDPEEWEECMDENGDIFYFNLKTQESVWELPTK